MYCQPQKPNMLTYLADLVTVLKKLHRDGLQVTSCTGRLTVKCHLLCVCLDLPARAIVANMKQYNGKYACNVCLDEGKSNPRAVMHTYYPFQEESSRRTHTSVIQAAKEASSSGVLNCSVQGIKGASPLLGLKYVDLTKVFPVDWMHCVLLGVSKYMLNLWLGNENKQKNFHIGENIALMDKRLLSIQVPDFIARKPRSLEECQHWKATECREWLLHYSIFVLQGILDQELLVHYSLLVSAVTLLAQDCITSKDIQEAEEMLTDFRRAFPLIYGEVKQTMNIHMLKHVPDCVRLYGPIFTFSCFGFESMNSYVKGLVHGSGHVNSQISFAIGMTKSLPVLVRKIREQTGGSDINALSEQLSSKFMSEDSLQERSSVKLGSFTEFTQDEERALGPLLPQQDNIRKFKRYVDGSIKFESVQYKKNKYTNNSTVAFTTSSGLKYGTILFFVKCSNGEHYAFVKMFQIRGSSIKPTPRLDTYSLGMYTERLNTLCKHIVNVKKSDTTLVPVRSIRRKCILMQSIDNQMTYISYPPNLVEHG